MIRARGSETIVHDVWSDSWRLFERRETPYGFAVLLGRPYPPLPVQGGSGGTQVIVTAKLAAFLRSHMRRPYEFPLPVSREAVRRIRKLLGIDHLAWTDARLDWWMDRIDDLATLPVEEFVARHGAEPWTRSGSMSEALVWQMRVALLGHMRRPAGWWRRPEVRALLATDLPASILATRLKISPTTVIGMRRKLHLLDRDRRAHKASLSPAAARRLEQQQALAAATLFLDEEQLEQLSTPVRRKRSRRGRA